MGPKAHGGDADEVDELPPQHSTSCVTAVELADLIVHLRFYGLPGFEKDSQAIDKEVPTACANPDFAEEPVKAERKEDDCAPMKRAELLRRPEEEPTVGMTVGVRQ